MCFQQSLHIKNKCRGNSGNRLLAAAFFDAGKEKSLDLNIMPLMGEIDLTYPQAIAGTAEYYLFEAVGHGSKENAGVIFTRVKDCCVVRENKETEIINSIINMPMMKGAWALWEHAARQPGIYLKDNLFCFKINTGPCVTYVRCQPYHSVNNINIVGYTPGIEKVAKPMRIAYMIEHPAETLPEICFTVLPGSGKLVCIERGESGYRNCQWSTNDCELNRKTANCCNEARGISREQEEAMVIGSMGKWKEIEMDNAIENIER